MAMVQKGVEMAIAKNFNRLTSSVHERYRQTTTTDGFASHIRVNLFETQCISSELKVISGILKGMMML